MKDIKLVTSILSALALVACGGGSGGGNSGSDAPSAAVTPGTYEFATVNTNPTVNSANTGVTGMASYTVTNEAAVRSSMINYVRSKLGNIYTQNNYNNLGRGASLRAGGTRSGGLTEEQQFEIAMAKINEMKGVLKDLTKSSTDKAAYINSNRELVAEALRLYGVDVNINNVSSQALLAAFNNLHLNNAGIDTALAKFDAAKGFVYNKEMLSDVDFTITGGDGMILRFQLDNDGKIVAMAGGNKDANNNFVVDPEHGWFARTGETGTFSTSLKNYELNLVSGISVADRTAHLSHLVNGEGEPLSGCDGLINLEFMRPASENPNKRTVFMNVFEEEKNKLLRSQTQGSMSDEDFAAWMSTLEGEIDWLYDHTFGQNNWWNDANVDVSAAFAANIETTGVGKDVVYNGKKLKYSDFGYIAMDKGGNLEYDPYMGGFDSKKIENPEFAATYHGTAVAGLKSSRDAANAKLLRDDTATLEHTVDGTSELTMNNLTYGDNQPWYNMKVTGKDNTNLGFEFTAKEGINDNYKFHGDTGAFDAEHPYTLTEVFAGTVAGINADTAHIHTDEGEFVHTPESGERQWRGSAQANYYGPSATETPTEANVGFNFSEEHIPTGQKVSVYGAFGGVKE